MKSKILSLFGLSVFIFAVLISFASAAATFTLTPSSLSFDKDDSSQTFTIENTGASILNMTLASQTLTDSSGNTVKVNFNETALSIAVSGSQIVTATSASLQTGFLFEKATKTYNINETGNSSNNVALTLNFVNSFCSDGAIDESDLKLKVDINNRGEGDDEEWLPLDTIEIEVELENNGNDDLNDVIFELGLFKEGSNTNIIDDMIWISKDEEEIEVGDVDEDEDEKHTFEFRVDPAELDTGDNDYILVVKAYPDTDEDTTCIDHSENLEDFGSEDFSGEISIIKENDNEKMVVIDEDSYPLVTDAFCGEQVTLSADIYNIGDEDFLDQIKVLLVNNELGLNLEKIIGGDLDEGEKTDVTFSFEIPSDADETQYVLVMEIFYDYDEDDEVYDEVSDDTFDALLKVGGNCESSSSGDAKATVNAVLESGGEAGEELVVKATITNTGTSTASYVLSAAGYAEWASSANVLPSTLTLSAGQSQEVSIVLDVNKDASGDKLFNIEVISGNSLVVSQPVSASVKASGLGSITGGVIGSNVYLWGIGLLNVILIVAIIFVVVRLMRK